MKFITIKGRLPSNSSRYLRIRVSVNNNTIRVREVNRKNVIMLHPYPLHVEKTVISASNCLANRQRFYSEPEILRQSTSSTSSYSSFKESSGNEFLEDMLLGNSCGSNS